MHYNSPKHIRPLDRQAHVRHVSPNYEETARRKTAYAIGAAAFEAVYYSRIANGVQCSCSHNPIKDPLNSNGEMEAETMSALLEGGDPEIVKLDDNGRTFIMEDYSASPTKSDVPLTPPSAPMIDDELEDVDFVDDEDMVDFSDNYPENRVLNGKGLSLPEYNISAANCGVCNKTGFIGGFNRHGGNRLVWSIPHWTTADFNNCFPNVESTPNTVDIADEIGEVTFEAVLPRNPIRVTVLGLLNNHARHRMGVDWKIEINGNEIRSLTDLIEYCTGQLVSIKIRSKVHFTHFEIEMVMHPDPFYIDISNWTKIASQQNLNDFNQLEVNIPAALLYVNRGDILYEKTTRVGWVVTDPNVIRSAHMTHGHSATLNRINERHDAFTIVNPYTNAPIAGGNRTPPETLIRTKGEGTSIDPGSPPPIPNTPPPEWGEW